MKVWLIIAASLVIIGLILFVAVMTQNQWDFTMLSTRRFETNIYEINEDFHNLSINADTADVVFALSNDETCTVECYEEEKAKHSVTVREDTLTIKVTNSKSWYDYIGFSFGSPKITVSLPKAEYTSLFINESTGDIKIPQGLQLENADISLSTGDVDFSASVSASVKIKTSTGNIRIENASAGELEVCVSTGKVTLTDVACQNLTSTGNTGDIFLNHMIATEKLSISRSTGNVRFDGSDAAEIFVETDTGNVTGSLLTDKVFLAHTDTGAVDVPKTVTGGKCEISTDTGNIKITIE